MASGARPASIASAAARSSRTIKPVDHALPPGARPGERSNITSLLLPGDLSAALEGFARKHDATLFGLAVAALTQCSAPPHLQVLGAEHGLGPLEPMQVAVVRSRASQGSKAVDSLYRMLLQTLRQAGL